MAEAKKKDVEVVSDEENAKKALEIHKQQKKNVEAAEASTMKSMFGMTETVTIAENSKHPYSITMRYPGTAIASQIEDDATNRYNGVNMTELMEQAIKHVIISPRITSLDFWDTHEGYSEVFANVLQFLNEGLS